MATLSAEKSTMAKLSAEESTLAKLSAEESTMATLSDEEKNRTCCLLLNLKRRMLILSEANGVSSKEETSVFSEVI